MAERTTGVRRLLASPAIYSRVQNLLGARAVRERVIRDFLRPGPGERLLDLGCGPGDVIELMPEVEYVGVDRDPAYIDAARSRYSGQGEFVCADVREVELPPRSFEAVLAIGVVHHLDDDGAAALFELGARSLADGGRMVTLDPARADSQPAIARFLIDRDRGHHVRGPEELQRLAARWFDHVEVECRHDLARVPYTHALIACRGPRRG